MSGEAALCLSNNLDWYGSILRAHGLAGGIANGLWTCRGEVPPYYSNAITVSPSETESQYTAIEDLGRALSRPFSVKDAFSALDLAPRGFRVLFAADWVWRAPRSREPTGDTGWQRVATATGLAQWEQAWRDNGSPADKQVFPATLLEDETLAFFALLRDRRIVAGCAANRSERVVGFSNFFSAGADPEEDFAAGVGAVSAFAPDHAVVGYEHGDAFDWAIGAGFRAVGQLRIWLKDSV